MILYVKEYKHQSNYSRYGICCLQNPKRPTRWYASFSVIESERCSSLSFTIEGIFRHASDNWNSKNYAEEEGL